MNLNVSESMFKKPLPLMLDNYFEYHPLQPVSHTFFNCKKVFIKQMELIDFGLHLMENHYFVQYVWLLVQQIIHLY